MTPAAVTIYQTRTTARALLAAGTGALGATLLLGFTTYAYLTTPAAIVVALTAGSLAYSARATRMERYTTGKTHRL